MAKQRRRDIRNLKAFDPSRLEKSERLSTVQSPSPGYWQAVGSTRAGAKRSKRA